MLAQTDTNLKNVCCNLGDKNHNDQNAVWSSTLLSDPITLDPAFNVLIKWYFEMVIKDSEMNDQ